MGCLGAGALLLSGVLPWVGGETEAGWSGSSALAAAASAAPTPTPNKLDIRRPMVVEPPDAGLIPYRTLMDESISLYEQKRYHKASTALFDYLEKPIPAVLSAEARYRLGRSLEVLNMPMLAMGMYRDITRFGPIVGKVYPEALSAWVLLSLKYDDTVELYNRLQHLPLAADPAGMPTLPYLRGLARLEHGQTEEGLRLLTGISSADTVVGRQASYAAAMALIQNHKRPLARKLLEPLQTGTPKGSLDVMTARELQLVDRLKELSILALARNAYAENRFADARALYAKISNHSLYQPQVQYELAWVAFFEDRGKDVLPYLSNLRLDRQMAATVDVPPVDRALSGGGPTIVADAELLAAMFYLRTNQHDLADGVLRGYLERLHVVRLALRDLDRAYESAPDRIWLARILMGVKPEIPLEGESPDGDARDPSLVALAEKVAPQLRAMVDDACRSRDISQSLARIDVLRQEYQVWGKQLSWWKSSALGQYSAKALAQEERKAIDLIGQTLEAAFLRERLRMSEHNVMGLALRREVTTQRLALASNKRDPDPYVGEPLPPFDFVRPEP